MKKIWTMMAMAVVFAGCSQDETDSPLNTYTLTGYADAESRTAFGTPGDTKIPFQWSAGDYINDGTKNSDALSNGGSSATFTFSGTSSPSEVYYNISGSLNQAYVQTTQTVGNLGTYGDFGYGTVDNGSFTLNHATSYLWFDVTSTLSNVTLESVKVSADEYIAGKATWSGSSFGTVSEGSNAIELTVNQPLSSTNSNVWAMVILPKLASKPFKVTYKLKVGNNIKYCSQTVTGKSNFTYGKTQKVSMNITSTELTDYAELRVLTFENGSQKWNNYSFSTYSYSWGESDLSNTYQIANWSDLIPDEDYGDEMICSVMGTYQYNGKSDCNWYDSGNTMLKHSFPKQSALDWEYTYDYYEFYNYQASGHALSDLRTTTVNQNDSFEKERYVYGTSAHSGNNFCVHHGYMDSYKESTGSYVNLPTLEFGDGEARVIDHMFVNNTVYTYNKLINGENSFGGTFDPNDVAVFKIVAKGYKTVNDNNPTTVEFKLRDENKNVVSDWTKWDLTGLGKIVKVEFNVVGTNTMIGDYGLIIPAYFAYDDVAVQF